MRGREKCRDPDSGGPATAITSAREILFWLGIALVYAGLAFRIYAIKVLGRYFTTSVAVVADQQVVEDVPVVLVALV